MKRSLNKQNGLSCHLVFWDRISCISGCLQTHDVVEDDLGLLTSLEGQVMRICCHAQFMGYWSWNRGFVPVTQGSEPAKQGLYQQSYILNHLSLLLISALCSFPLILFQSLSYISLGTSNESCTEFFFGPGINKSFICSFIYKLNKSGTTHKYAFDGQLF